MSGGHFDYSQHGLSNCLNDFFRDKDVKKRFPQTAKLLKDLENILGKTLHDIDWDLSDDAYIKDDKEFDKGLFNKLKDLVNEKN